MVEYVSVSIRLPVEIHTKLKLMSAVSSKPMNELIIKWVESQKVQIPGYVKEDEPQRAKPAKRQKVQTSSADEEEIKRSVLAWKEEGLSYQAIADRFTEQGVSTVSGRGSWNKGSVSNLLKKWGVKQTIKT